MQLNILNITNQAVGKKNLPEQFNEIVRPDIISRAVLAIQSHKRHVYGAKPDAGKRASAYVSKRRRAYKTTYGIGQSRTPRKIMSRRGARMNWVGAFAPQTVGGRRAHPPKAEKEWSKKINKKERRKAIRSAISATVIKEEVCKKHIIPDNYPFIIEDAIEKIDKTKKVKGILTTLGLGNELERVESKKTRPGKGSKRGRKYKKKVGPLIVVSDDCKLLKSGVNLPGVDVIKVNKLNAEILAPGTQPGRLTIFTKSAVERMEKERLFL